MDLPTEEVMRDLVDTLFQENLFGFADGEVEPAGPGQWRYRAAGVEVQVRPGGRLQEYRYSQGPVRHDETELTPDELLRLLASDSAHTDLVAADLHTAVEHARVTLHARHDLLPRSGSLLAGERLAATRNRPFHPTARAASGWTASELAAYGPMRPSPLALTWVAVRTEMLRHGSGEDSRRIAELLLDEQDAGQLADVLRKSGLPSDEFTVLPVHPWQFEHVLPREFVDEFTAGTVRVLGKGIGQGHPTASLRTITTAPESARHLKLPLGIATLGAARLLPPRYLDNGERGERLLRTLLDRDPGLRARVLVCDERTWVGWQATAEDEFADRPGQLAAQVREYPGGVLDDPETIALPMAALAAHEWRVFGPVILCGRRPLDFFTELAELFLASMLGFLRYGVLPEPHGQNVVLTVREGRPERLVLRDHDTVRLYPEWLTAAGVANPGYRVRPGAPQSLSLETAQRLVGYLQTLGVQVNLYAIADAIGRQYGIAEDTLWDSIRTATISALDTLDLPAHVSTVLRRQLLEETRWPSRQVLGPLLRSGPSSGVSMPAGTGSVPNPLRRP
ncbi:Siderophore synthetase component [Amycolatopsis marina]|uniref:Siderophore synthetase component n=1 Tax=Amycolatopsis marina TaxID=490629 RepID=A0A1I0Y0G6_9PSEU|nr:IucA/IucC family protein [Amycolatopsis marina]SFB06839.1 Siderophore synthetase component [Amycolatopsis marina]